MHSLTHTRSHSLTLTYALSLSPLSPHSTTTPHTALSTPHDSPYSALLLSLHHTHSTLSHTPTLSPSSYSPRSFSKALLAPPRVFCGLVSSSRRCAVQRRVILASTTPSCDIQCRVTLGFSHDLPFSHYTTLPLTPLSCTSPPILLLTYSHTLHTLPHTLTTHSPFSHN